MATNPYERTSGINSGLGQPQQRNCPTGYQWNATQGKCVVSNMQSAMTQNTAQDWNNFFSPQTTQTTQTQPKPGQSDYAKLLAQAIDINPQLPGIQQANTASPEQQMAWGNQVQPPPPPTGNLRTSDFLSASSSGYDQSCLARCQENGGDFNTCLRQCASIDEQGVNQGGGIPCTDLATRGCQATMDAQHTVPTPCSGAFGGTQFRYCPGDVDITDTGIESNARQECLNRGRKWIQTGGAAFPNVGYCADVGGGEYPGGNIGGAIGDLPWVSNPGELPAGGFGTIADIGGYLGEDLTNPLRNLAGGVFGGQTLDQLEQDRINAAKADYARLYGESADDLTRRLNEQAAGAGMFHSGSREGAIGNRLGDLGEEYRTREQQAIADIRGERPELLLKERQQQIEAIKNATSLDIDRQKANIDGFLGNKAADIDSWWKSGQLTLDHFDGNVAAFVAWANVKLSEITSEREWNEANAKITEMYNNMSRDQRNWFSELIMSIG